MEHVSSVRPTRKFPEKVENLKRWSRFLGWNFRTECRVPFTLLVVCTSSRSTVGHPATYRGWDQMEQLFTNRKFHFCYHRNFQVFFLNGKRPRARIWRQTSSFHLICIKFGSKKFVVYETGLNIWEHCRPYMTDFFVSQVTLKEFLFYINFRFHVC